MSKFLDIGIIGLLLTVISLAISLYQTLKNYSSTKILENITSNSKQMTDETKKSAVKMEELSVVYTQIIGKISTRYICAFPDFMPQVTKLISSARESVYITYVIPATAIFSNYEGWLMYKQEIEKIMQPSSKIQVQAVFPTSDEQQKFLRLQFASAGDDWLKAKEDADFLYKLRTLIGQSGFSSQYSSETANFDQFIDIFARISTDYRDRLFYRAEIFEIDFRPQIYIWIVDKREAIFVIPILKPIFSAHAFITTDRDVINVLLSLQDEYCKIGQPVSPQAGGL